jgi:hypothetical protein
VAVQVREQLPVREPVRDQVPGLDRQGGLADPWHAVDRRDHHRPRQLPAGPVQQPSQRRQLTGPAREVRHRRWELPQHRRRRGGNGRRCGSGPGGWCRVAGQQTEMQLPEVWPGIGTQLLSEDLPGVLVGLQRLSRAAGLLQGAHQLVPEPLPQRMARRQLAQLRHQLRSTAAADPSLGPQLQGIHPKFVQPGRLRRDQRTSRYAS